MQVEITQVTPWSRALDAARWTMGKDSNGKEPSEKFITEQMMSVHSPKRMVEFDIKIKGIPYYNAVHFVRHHVGVEKFQCTLRDDRNEDITDRKVLPQDTPVNLWIACNAEALISISNVRLCMMAEKNTRMIWNIVKVQMQNKFPIVARFMVPQCIYRGFCPEAPDKSCRYVTSDSYKERLVEYRNGFVY